MDILAGLGDKLRFIERLYATASKPFTETIRKIEAGEPPFEPPYFDPDYMDTEPPFLADWQEADDALNLVGQAALTLVQSALREYIDAFVWLSRQKPPAGRGNWFERYKRFFLEVYGIDWEAGPFPPAKIEEINLARDDIQHSGKQFGMERRMTEKHLSRFPDGLFAYGIDRQISGEFGLIRPRIYITAKNLHEAIRRVEVFCGFLDECRPKLGF